MTTCPKFQKFLKNAFRPAKKDVNCGKSLAGHSPAQSDSIRAVPNSVTGTKR